jgi:type I restriction enzyme S subunit
MKVGEAFMSGTAEQKRVPTNFVSDFPLAFPSLDEQTAIANYLDRKTAEIDTLIAQKQRLIELYQEEKTAIINQAVTQGISLEKGNHKGLPLRDSGIDWLIEIPEEWKVAELRRFICFITSGSRGWAEHYADQGKIFVRIGNLTRHSIDVDLSDIQYVDPPVGAEGERTKICEGDVLFSITAYIGSVAVATDAIVGAYINQHIALVRPLIDKVFPKYVAYVALSDLGQSQLSGKGYGGTKVQLALDDVKSLLIPVPPLSEQATIVRHIETESARIDAKIAKTQRIIELQKEYRTALISEVVTGKIKVTP